MFEKCRRTESRGAAKAHQDGVQWVRVPEDPWEVLRQSWHPSGNGKVHEQQNRERHQDGRVNDHRPANEAKHKQQHAARIHGAALAWWNAGSKKAMQGPRGDLWRQSLSFSRHHKNNAISSSSSSGVPLFCSSSKAMTSPPSSPSPLLAASNRCSSAEARPEQECFSLLPRRVHRLQSSQICIIYSQQALRTSGYRAHASMATHTHKDAARRRSGRAGTAADIFPACPNVNTPKS